MNKKGQKRLLILGIFFVMVVILSMAFVFNVSSKFTSAEENTENNISIQDFSLMNETNNLTNSTNQTEPINPAIFENYKIKLVSYNQDGYTYKTNNTNYDFYIKGASNWGDGTKFCNLGHCLIYQPQDMSYRNNLGSQDYISSLQYANGQVTNETMNFNEVFPKVDLTYNTDSQGVKQFYILKEKPRTPKSYLGSNVSLDFGGYIKFDGLDIYADGVIQTGNFRTTGKIEFKDGSKTLFYLPEPIAWDSNNQTQKLSYEIQIKGKQIWFYVQTPYSFLESAVYPVYIDPTTVTDGLISYYKLDETSGTTVTDSHGSNNGVFNGGLTSISGLVGTAYDLDGSSDWFSFSGDNYDLDSNMNYTISLWVNPDVLSMVNNYIYTTEFDTSAYGILSIINGKARWDGHGNSALSTTILTTGNWYMLTTVVDGSSAKLYVNGVLESTKTKSLSGGTFTDYINFGTYTDGTSTYKFNGKMDELLISGRALTSTEVSELYNSGNGLTYPFGQSIVYCEFAGYVKDENTNALNNSQIIILNQNNLTQTYNTTTDSNGYWAINLTNSTNTYLVGAYYNNTLIGGLKPYISGAC